MGGDGGDGCDIFLFNRSKTKPEMNTERFFDFVPTPAKYGRKADIPLLKR